MGQWAKRMIAARLICALALIVLGFSGHAFADPRLDPHGAQYRLPDGTYAALCEPSAEKSDRDSQSKHCDVCVLSASHLLAPPEADAVALPQALWLAQVWPLAFSNPKPILSHHGQSRAPPLNV
jgi:hypothetical protein